MRLTWDTAQDRIWFARWDDTDTVLRFFAVVEQLPDRGEWDWSVWLPDDPKITRRGIARSALEASVTAGEAVEECLRTSRMSLKGL